MVVYHEISRRKVTGGRYRLARKKRLGNMGSLPTLTKVGNFKPKFKREKGGSLKQILLSTNKINVTNQKTKKTQTTEIVTVVENPANRNFVRRNIITRGTVLETKLGKVRVTSRPGQEGTINGVLIS
ncbi:30S ribosomal protein S8e [Candidatus Woesearchaeota archaeon]|nr:30S ribosomal protein S8e [Candidatus Woesearchaeota archaeon]